MESETSVAALSAESEGSVVISGGDQQLVLSAEDAAQLLAQAGIQLGDNEQIVIGTDLQHNNGVEDNNLNSEQDAVDFKAQQSFLHQNLSAELDGGVAIEGASSVVGVSSDAPLDDGTVLYIDPNDPQAKELLQKAGLKLSADGTVTAINNEVEQQQLLDPLADTNEEGMTLHAADDAEDVKHVINNQHGASTSTSTTTSTPAMNIVESALSSSGLIGDPSLDYTRASDSLQLSPERHSTNLGATTNEPPMGQNDEEQVKQVLHVGADQQQVLYSVTGEDGKTQQYMMFCPKDMDQNTLIRTLVNQISSDPATKGGKKTIRITHQKGAANSLTELPAGSRIVSETPAPAPVQDTSSPTGNIKSTSTRTTTKKPSRRGGRSSLGSKLSKSSSARQRNSLPTAPLPLTEDLTNSTSNNALGLSPMASINTSATTTALSDVTNTVATADATGFPSTAASSDVVESVFPDLPLEPTDEGTRVYVKCNYCTGFRSTLNGETWEAILNHILPVVKEEIQSAFYGDLSKHFTRCLRVEVNGRTRVLNTNGSELPQCDVILTHSLVCRKTQKEFIVRNPDATFVANLAKHIKMTQPGHTGRGNSVLCIFCNSPFTFEDYLRHINPHIENILSTLKCFAGAYCATEYEQTIRSVRQCQLCNEPEAADLRFLPCTKFSNEYQCSKKLQFGVDCFREHFGDNGFMRLNTSAVAKCSVCRNSAQVQCAVFQISAASSTSESKNDSSGNNGVKSELCVCVNCQKQFINVVMKEQGFEERLKHFQLKNMEQLCSVLRVILNSSKSICEESKTFVYSVHENVRNPNSSVHNVRTAEEVSSVNSTSTNEGMLSPSVSRGVGLVALAESEIAACMCKVFFICDLCLFTVDLTSLIALPRDKQKNDMLLAIVLEHIIPHTESLMNLIIGTTLNTLLHLKYEIAAHASDVGPHRKIVLSLKRKFKAPNGNVEITIDKDEGKTFDQIRFAIKSDKQKVVAFNGAKPSSTTSNTAANQSVHQGPGSPGSNMAAESPNSSASDSSANNATPLPMTVSSGGLFSSSSPQMTEINKFIEKNKGKLTILAQTGCNTSLLKCYVECKLCSKFSFPDFRLTSSLLHVANTPGISHAPSSIELCENCVDTVLRLCIPTEPETLSQSKDCLALNEPKSVGHRLVLSNSVKKWLSLDGVHLIKKTVEDFEDSKTANECSNIFKDTLKKYTVAVLRTCQKDADILTGVAGFCITEAFFGVGTHRGQLNTAKERQEVQVAILGRKSAQRRLALLQRQQQQKGKDPPRIVHLGRGIGSDPSTNPVQELLRNLMKAKSPEKQLPINNSSSNGQSDSKAPCRVLSDGDGMEEESISAIQSFLDESAAREKAIKETMANLPPGLKITPTGKKGVVNIKAVSSSNRSPLEAKTNTATANSSMTTTDTEDGDESPSPNCTMATKENEDPSGNNLTSINAAVSETSTVATANTTDTTAETNGMEPKVVENDSRPRKRKASTEKQPEPYQPLEESEEDKRDGDGKSESKTEPKEQQLEGKGEEPQEEEKESDSAKSSTTETEVPPGKRRRLRSTTETNTETVSERTKESKETSQKQKNATDETTPTTRRRSGVIERLSNTSTPKTTTTTPEVVERALRGSKKTTTTTTTSMKDESSADEVDEVNSTPTRSRRQRRERKIFDL